MKNKFGLFFAALLFFIFVYSPLSSLAADYVGADTCKNCHQDRFASYNRTYHSYKSDAKTPASVHECETCHGPGSEHVAAGGGKGIGGIISLDPSVVSPDKINETCLKCHTEGRMFWKTGVHASQKLSCVSCHNPHPEEKEKNNKFMLRKPTETDTCFMCHKDKQAMMQRSSHMPIREGKVSCASCHDPHGTSNPRNLRAVSVNELCYQCHTEKRGPFLWEHAPVRESCLNCHDPHGSQHDKLLISKRPFLICQRCHITTRHPSSLYDRTQINMQNNRIFNRACLNCHSLIHGSNHPSGQFFLR